MTSTRRDILWGFGASVGLALPIAPVALRSIPATPLPLPAPTGPIELYRYVIMHRQRTPVWSDDFAWAELSPFLPTHRWHFDDQTYTTPLICCVENGRVFTVLLLSQPVREEKVGVFEIMTPYDTLQVRARDYYAKELGGAARHAAARAAAILADRREAHPGAVYLDFPAEDLASPVVTDAPPLIIHTWLSPSRDLETEDEDFEEDECDDDEIEGDQPA